MELWLLGVATQAVHLAAYQSDSLKHIPLKLRVQRELGMSRQPQREKRSRLNEKKIKDASALHMESQNPPGSRLSKSLSRNTQSAFDRYRMPSRNPHTRRGSHDSICSQPRSPRHSYAPLQASVFGPNQQHRAPRCRYCSIDEGASIYRIMASQVPSNLCHPTRHQALSYNNSLLMLLLKMPA